MTYANLVHSTKSTPDGVYAEALSKSFGEVQALRKASFHAPAGSVLGLLGHNGAGKTTAIRILTTLADPTSGEARVAGFDVVTEGARVRERIGLADVGDRLVKTFSGGMRRRLDLAASLVADPPVLFLDEPTTGLDPEARTDMWEVIQSLVAQGTSL